MSTTEIFNAILDFDDDAVPQLVRDELDAGTEVDSILNDGLIAAMDEVGQRFSSGDLFVPEMLMAAQAMKAGMEVIRPMLAEAGTAPKGTLVIGTVQGDLHDIGKNLVAMMLEGAGFKVVDLGVDVEPGKFVEAALEHNADAVCMSALLTTTMPAMEATVKAIGEQSFSCKTMVGGAPVTQAFAEKISADGYSEDAPSAVVLARRLISS
jgi:5-methyltetrahydrofolate--homocysteine methyltransferase